MIVTFYCDIPEYCYNNRYLFATTDNRNPPTRGFKRVRFDVDIPDSVTKEYDAIGTVSKQVEVV